MSKIWDAITYPFRMVAEFIKFNIEYDKELARNRMERDKWIDRKIEEEEGVTTVQGEQKSGQTKLTELFDSFTCKVESLNQMLEIMQDAKHTRGFHKMKVDGLSVQGTTATVIVRYYSPKV